MNATIDLQIQDFIDAITDDLSDEDYLDVLEAIVDQAQTAIDAKQEELAYVAEETEFNLND